jgi:uncharacterized caspase-like protein
VGEYQDGRIPALQFADEDARAFRDFLLSEAAGMGGFDDDHVRVLLNEEATLRNIRSALFSFLRGATEDDLVLIYFAGHGAPDPGRLQDHYLLAHDTDLGDLPASALLMEDVNDAVRRLYYRHLVVVADACHSGGVGGQTATRSLSLNTVNSAFLDRMEASSGGHVTFTASQVNQLSQEDERWGGGHGVFTYHFLEGLRGGADEDGDAIVTLGEAMEFVRDRVRRDTRNAQIPTISQTAFDWYLPMSVVLADYVSPGPDRAEWTPSEASAEDPAQRQEIAVPTPAETRPLNPGLRPLPRIGVEVSVEALGDALAPETLAALIKREMEDHLRGAEFPISDLDAASEAAEIVVMVEAAFVDQGEVMAGMRSVGMELSLSAREAGNPSILTSSSHSSNGAGLSMTAAARASVERAVDLGTPAMADALKARWSGQGGGSFSVILRVRGLEGYGQVLWLTDNLGGLFPESAGIVERRADLLEGTAELEWFTPLPTEEVARAIEAQSFQDYEIKIVRVLPGAIEIRLGGR